MDTKKMLACLLGATLMVQAGSMTYAKEVETKILSLDTAIKQAQAKSLQLKITEKKSNLDKENADMAYLQGGYYAYDAKNVQATYTKKQEEVIKDQITLSVTSLYEDILLSEKQLEMMNSNLALLQKQNLKSQIEKDRGLKSDLAIQQQDLTYMQTLQSKTDLEQKINLKYTQLGDMVGVTMSRYTLEEPEALFEPYKDVANLNAFASSKAQKHIDLWKATEDLRVALETPIMTSDYIQVVTMRANREIAADSKKMTEENLEKAIREIYVNTKQLEQKYNALTSELALKEKELGVNKVYLEKGMISQLQYDQSVLEYEKVGLELEQVVNNHNLNKFQLDHPHLIRAGV
ncbi:MAG: hypothetical protein RR090_01470 [Niameybacter sp.]|uniref:hypothetical protein n=1 Tax=Niameybacter sp. TaxID=2033640 RepID=UPI002FC74C8E